MPVVNAAVILMAYPAGGQLAIKMDVHAYVQYFFNPEYGQKAYWLKQTDNDQLLNGAVFDWRVHTDPSPDLSSRTAVAQAAVDIMQSEAGVDFSPFDLVIVILGINPSMPSDGGSTGVHSEHRSHAAIVARVGDRFDFLAHEIGHAFNVPHSFGSILFQTTGEGPGGYGHPYCIMSAMAYGGLASPYSPKPPRNNWPEYAPLGPSLNAVSALGRGWIHAHSFIMPGAGTQDFVLRSRHDGGRDLGRPPQAVEVKAANGNTFVIEYREDASGSWDQGQGAPMLIVTQGRGGIGDKANPGKHSGTYLAHRALPVTLGSASHYYQAADFGFVILGRAPLDHTARIRVWPGRAARPAVNLSSKVAVERVSAGRGETTWAPGEKLCLEGTWTYTKFEQRQTWTFEVTCNDVAPPLAAAWVVEGIELTASPQTVTTFKPVSIASPKLTSATTTTYVTLECEIESLPNGSRLRVRNRPLDETYHFGVTVTLSASIGATIESFAEKFTGILYDFGPEFDAAQEKCWKKFIDVNDKYAKSKLLLEPDYWRKFSVRERERAAVYLDVLSILHTNEHLGSFEQALADLPAIVGAEFRNLTTIPLDDRFDVPSYEGVLHQPAPTLETLIAARVEEIEKETG